MFLFAQHVNKRGGLTFVETIVGVALFAFVSLMLYGTYSRVFIVARIAQARVNAVALANEQFEIIRNLSYSNVGVIGGIPNGIVPPVQTLVRGGMIFLATTTIRNIDYPFDGLAGSIPNDTSPEDNKLVEIDISCISCSYFRPLTLMTNVGPKDLEGTSTNGSLFIQAVDSGGLGVANADVFVFNNSSTTVISVNDVTSTSGMLQLVGTPPGVGVYQIMVSKAGYSSDRNYNSGGPTTTNPVKPYATVAAQTVTQVTFAIDRVATLNFSSVTAACAAVPNVGVQFAGTKLIGKTPPVDVLKYNQWFSTGASGLKTLNDIEWDSYTITASSTIYDLAGIVPLSPLTIAPGAVQNVQLIMIPKNRPSVLITVKDAATGLPVSGADVKMEMGGASTTQTTGRGFLKQTDWSGGSGQSAFTVANQYALDDGNTDVLTSPGSVILGKLLGLYYPSGQLTSSTFDTGSVSNFYQFTYQPTSQPFETGDSARFQLATGNSTSSWTYLGPDGTASTYYNATTTDIAAVNNGNRYLRYKMFLSTASSTLTPSVSDIQFTFTSSCVPPGQVLFDGLTPGTYNITVSKTGYTTANDTVVVGAGTWQEKIESIGP